MTDPQFLISYTSPHPQPLPNQSLTGQYGNLRGVASPYLSLIDCDPVCGGEPFVVFDVIDAVLEVAVALRQVHLQQVAKQVLQV